MRITKEGIDSMGIERLRKRLIEAQAQIDSLENEIRLRDKGVPQAPQDLTQVLPPRISEFKIDGMYEKKHGRLYLKPEYKVKLHDANELRKYRRHD